MQSEILDTLDKLTLQCKVNAMSNHWAEENLDVIRTLMERSAIYRRALAPLMIAAGLVGVGASTLTCFVKIEGLVPFAVYWLVVAALAQGICLLLVRRQALKSEEEFWSAPTRRVARAALPGFFVGAAASLLVVRAGADEVWELPLIWSAAYGCGIHAAGFFMPRGMKLFGWLMILLSLGLFLGLGEIVESPTTETAHYLMGGLFGVLHLVYGVYLRFTETAKESV
jgi:hypothetical protein